MALESYRDSFAHMEWADAAVWRSVLALGLSASDAATRERLYHIHLTQRWFLHLWLETAPDAPPPSAFGDLGALCRWGRDYHRQARAFVADLGEPDLRRDVPIPWSAPLAKLFGAEPQRVGLGESMFQVTSHTAHHRGQVAARLRQLGGEPPLIDFIAWIWHGRPAATWPE